MESRRPPSIKTVARNLGIALASMLLGLSLAEFVLRCTLPEANGWFIWPPGLDTHIEVERGWFPGVEGEARMHVNSLGLRGSEIPAEAARRVIALGGSTTECLYLDQEKTWPVLLEKTLNERDPSRLAWIGNAGRSGHTLRENVLQLDELERTIPRIDVVLLLPGINDLSKRLAQGDDYDPNLLARDDGVAAVKQSAFSLQPLAFDAHDPIYKRTALWRLAGALRRRLAVGDRQHEGYDAHVYQLWRDHRRAASRWIDVLPDLGGALEEYRRNLERLIDTAERTGARIVLATQPMLWRADMPARTQALLWMGGVGDFQHDAGAAYYTLPALIEGMRRYNDVVRVVAREKHVECVDVAAELDGDTSVFYDDCHFTEAGARRVAEAWATLLVRAHSEER